MSMLYLWHPAVSASGTELDLILTRGDSDQVDGGSERFVEAVLKAVGIKQPAEKWSIKPNRCNFYGEYWREEGWRSQWDFAWRMAVHFKNQIEVKPLPTGYLGLMEIDDYSPLAESYKYEPYACLVIAAFTSQEKARAAAEKLAGDKEIETARHAAAAPEPQIKVLQVAPKEFHLRAAIGSGDEPFFTGGYPALVVSMLEAAGGATHAEG